jgi:hypothetical protein
MRLSTSTSSLGRSQDLREPTKTISFGVLAEGGGSADYGFVGLRMSEVVSWEIKGMFDTTTGAALWAELQGFSPQDPRGE